MPTHDEKFAAGLAYEDAFKRLKNHIGDCERCAFLGDACAERDELIDTMLACREVIRTQRAKVRRAPVVGYDECINCGARFDAKPEDKQPLCPECK